MPFPSSRLQIIDRCLCGCELKLYPALKRVPIAQRSHALRAARATELDVTERAGVVASVVVAAYLLQPALAGSSSLIATSMIQFLLAWPLLAVLVAPWLVRRTRRGLLREARRFEGGASCQVSQDPTAVKTPQRQPTLARKRGS